MTDTDQTAIEAATGAVVLARQRLWATRRARILGRARTADIARARLALAAARAELSARRGDAGWWARPPGHRPRRPSAITSETDMLRQRSGTMTSFARIAVVIYMLSMTFGLLVAQWPVHGPRLIGPGGHAAHAGDVLVLAATATASLAVLKR